MEKPVIAVPSFVADTVVIFPPLYVIILPVMLTFASSGFNHPLFPLTLAVIITPSAGPM